MRKAKRTIAEKGLSKTGRLLLMIICLILAGVAVYGKSTDSLLWSTADNDDPFSGYVDLFSLQTVDDLEAQGFECNQFGGSRYSRGTHCILNAVSAPFTKVEARISRDTVQRLTFELQADTVDVQDLLDMWGEAEIDDKGNADYLYWRDQHIVAIAQEAACHRASLETQDVWRVYFFNE